MRKTKKGERRRRGLAIGQAEKQKTARLAVSGARTGKSQRRALRQTLRKAREQVREQEKDTEMEAAGAASGSKKRAKKKAKATKTTAPEDDTEMADGDDDDEAG